MNNRAESQARMLCESIAAMVATLDVDYDRFSALIDMRAEWFEENPGSFIEPHDPRNTGRWAMANPDEADELAELAELAMGCVSVEDAQERIQEDALSVEVRTSWHTPGETTESGEFRILLCTGGPHVELVGDLDRGEPVRVRVLYKDWGTSGEFYDFDHDAVLAYCREFYFGE